MRSHLLTRHPWMPAQRVAWLSLRNNPPLLSHRQSLWLWPFQTFPSVCGVELPSPLHATAPDKTPDKIEQMATGLAQLSEVKEWLGVVQRTNTQQHLHTPLGAESRVRVTILSLTFEHGVQSLFLVVAALRECTLSHRCSMASGTRHRSSPACIW
jgi:hypothetical protein